MSNVNSVRMRSRSSRFRHSLHDVVSSVSSYLSPKAGGHQSSDPGWTKEIIVAFSGIDPSEEVKKFILQRGGDFIIGSDGINKLHKVTHLVVGRDELKPRRIKLLAALCVCPSNIVVCDWIEESLGSNKFIPPDRFHISLYSDVIEKAETEHAFSMKSTLNNAIAALEFGGILAGKCVYVGPGVIGGSGPSRDEVSALLHASGAVYIDRSTGLKKMASNQGDVIIITKSDRTVPAAVVDALANGAFEMNWTQFVSAMLKQEFGFMDASPHLSLIDGKHVIDVTQETTTQQKQGDSQVVKILSINLQTSPTRSLSNAAIGEPERAYLGPNGVFEVYKYVGSHETVVRYVDDDGIIKFEALVPLPEDCHKAIQGNAGHDICMFWDACNVAFSSGGTTIRGALGSSSAVAHRRHFFWFNCDDDLKLALFHMFGQDRELVNEFFDRDGRFYASETQPDHATIKLNDAMEGEEVPVRVGYFGDSALTYQYDPRSESQAF